MVNAVKLIELHDVFTGENPEDRMGFIDGLSKKLIIIFLSSINLYVKDFIFNAYSREQEESILRFLFNGDPRQFSIAFNGLKTLYKGEDLYPIFNRQANLIAINEVLESDLPIELSEKIDPIKAGYKLLKYYLAVNSLIIQNQKFSQHQGLTPHEQFLQGIAGSNELNLPYFPIEDILRSNNLFEHLKHHSKYGTHIKDYFEKYSSSPEYFLKALLQYANHFLFNRNEIKPTGLELSGHPGDYLFLYPINQTTGVSILEPLKVKKGPIFKIDDKSGHFLDLPFMTDKGYFSFINDFWFDYLKEIGIKRSEYIADIGLFFESYIGQIFSRTYSGNQDVVVQSTDALKRKIGKREVELADVYLREDTKILVGQAKASFIKSIDKYVIEDSSFFKDKSKFYSKFGVDQLFDTTFKYLFEDPLLFDENVPNSDLTIYPVLFFHERVLLTPTFNLAIQNYFIDEVKSRYEEQLVSINEDEVELDFKRKFRIKPITCVYISELEILECLLGNMSLNMFSLLDEHWEKTKLTAPLIQTLYNYLGPEYSSHLGQRFENKMKNIFA